MIAHSAASYSTVTIDPIIWLEEWLPELSGREAKVAVGYASLADAIYDELAPAAEVMVKRTGLGESHFYEIRKGLKDRGVISVRERPNQTPIIQLMPRVPTT